MPQPNFLRLLTIFSLALFNISFGTLPANALAVERGHMARGINHAHVNVAKKRGDSSKQCKPRPSAPASVKASTSAPANAHLVTPSPVSQLSPQTTTSTSSSKSSKPSSAPSNSGSSGNGKITLSWSNNEETSICNFITSHTKYYYNWKLEKAQDLGNCDKVNDLIFVATIHDASQISQVASVLKAGVARFVKGFNEPNIASQANIDPHSAFSLWEQHIEPLANLGYTLVAPSVTTDDSGLKWLQTFMGLCKNCKIYAIDLHHYSVNAQDFITAANKFQDTFKMTTWVTEIGCVDYSGHNQYCSQDVFNAYFNEAVSFMQQTSWIETYSWFSMFRQDELPNGVAPANSMVTCPNGPSSSCHPNALGYQYLNP